MARRSVRRRRGPRGMRARGGHERVGTAATRDPGLRLAPPRRPAMPGGCAGPCRRVGRLWEWVSGPHKAAACVAGPELCPLLDRTGKAPLSGAALSELLGALGPFATCSGAASFRLPLCSSDTIHARWAGAPTLRGAQNSGGRGQRLSSAREGEV